MYSKKHQEILKEFAREHRNNSTLGEVLIWKHLLSKKKLGYQFNRQFRINNFIVDFISRKLKLIIEIDGYSHLFKQEKDKQRDLELHNLGYTVLRFQEREIRYEFENVVRCIIDFIEEFEKTNERK